ncbi:LytR family transcriptional regulator [Labedella populi]|uniref:LytR family transcriptional regulator n=1 Tax=Labedella populi TaxID=2498850 RepID=A0A3S4AG97_9MICO|nr:LCP family protein [Labedella populi]RWZ68129.1 LytR family transcriptional regulator [Labedella populi]
MARSTRDPEQTVTRHARGHRRGPVGAALRGVAIALAVVLVSGAAVAAYAVWDIGSGIAGNAVDIGQDGEAAQMPSGIGELEGGFNMLVIGADNSANQNTSAYGKRDVTLNDVNMLVHVAEDHQSAVVVSFPRDLVIPVPSCPDPDTGEVHAEEYAAMINTAFAKGGEKGGLGCVAATVTELTGLDIDYAAQFTFASVIQMTNALGGVEVCLADPIKDRFSGLDLDAGVNTIQGEQALQFLRTRKAVGDGSDLSRIALQQTYMSSLVKKLKSDGTLGDVTKLYGIAKVASESLSLSRNLANINAMVSMALTVRNLDLENIQLVQYPVGESPANPNRVVPQTETADQLMAAIAADTAFTSDPEARRVGVEDSESETPSAPETESAPPSTPAPGETATTPPSGVIDGLVGQSAAQESCVVKN